MPSRSSRGNGSKSRPRCGLPQQATSRSPAAVARSAEAAADMPAPSFFLRRLVADASAISAAAAALRCSLAGAEADADASAFSALSAAAAALSEQAEGLSSSLAGAEADAETYAREIADNDPSAAKFARVFGPAAAPKTLQARPPTKTPPARPRCSAPACAASPSDAAQAALLLALLGDVYAGDAAAERHRDERGRLRIDAERLSEKVEAQERELRELRRLIRSPGPA